ncbi:MAG: hydrogenase formation protein HypD [Bacteroidota bacterium]
MRYVTEFRNKEDVKRLVAHINKYDGPVLRFMEVCGGHTMAIQRFGIPSMLPENVRLLSGPGCPVCVTSRKFIDEAIALSRRDDAIIATYGDLIRVPGSWSTLEQERGKGADVRIVLSSLQALQLAVENKHKKIIFLGIGFETTAPATAVAVQEAYQKGVSNFFVLSAHKVMPPAMESLVEGEVKLDGFLAPGHVSAVTGPSIYNKLATAYSLPVVISGFEPVDMLQSIGMLINQKQSHSPRVEIQYRRVVKPSGNVKARDMLNQVFSLEEDWWRGLGILPESGLKLKEPYREFRAEKWLPSSMEPAKEPRDCICGKVLKGLNSPNDCKLFGKACYPGNPVGACMVSSEGACQAYYNYGEK